MPAASLAADGPAAPYLGQPVKTVIDNFRAAGYPIAYSTNLVGNDLFVTIEPASAEATEIVRQILEPHGLTLQAEESLFLVVRMESRNQAEAGVVGSTSVPSAGSVMETITVSASRYEISRDIAASQFVMDQRTIQNMPDIGEDPMRVTHRLPGAAASGASAKVHFRGGEDTETGIMLNGQWLFDPFHIRDYQSVFSVIDARAIEGVEVYTGGFPVRYGDRMSGVLLMESLASDQPRHNEIGVSVFNTSLLTAGSSSDLSWLLSARRGNLDLVIDPKFGQPSYYDVFAELAYEFSPDNRLSMNMLFANDAVELVLETDPAEREQSRSDTRNAQLWLQLRSRWSPTLTSTTVLSATSYSNRRNGFTNDMEQTVAIVSDDRDIEQRGLRQDWTWHPSDNHLMQWGLQAMYEKARYDYMSTAEYFGLPALYLDQPTSVSRMVSAAPKGGSYSVFFSDRWQVTPKTVVEWGLRWDDQTYTGLTSDSQLSPRFNILYQPGPRTELRFSWGRFYQSQGIQELQVEDGISNFWPAQRADHLIAGLRQRIGDDYSLRVELFHKDIGQVRPRFENLFDPLALIPELQPDRIRLDPSSAESRGFEISIDRSSGPWTWWASYTLSKASDRIDGVNESRSWDQRHAFQGGFAWNDDAWTLAVAASAHSGWPATDLMLVADGTDENGDPAFVAVPGPRNALQHGTFASLDVRLSRRFKLRRSSLLAFIEISNLTNRRNECCLDWDLIEDENGNEALERGLDYWMPLLPAIGVLWEF